MKQLINPLPAGRMPVFKDDLLILQDENYLALKNICLGIGGPIIVGGCIATDLGGGNVNISSGVLFLDNELIKFNGYTGAYPINLAQGTPVTSTKTYFDASVQTVYSERTIIATALTPMTDYVEFNFDNTADRLINVLATRFKDNSSAWINLDGGGLFKYRKDAFGFVHLVGVVGTGAGTIANDSVLPPGYRPASTETFYTYRYDRETGAAPSNLGVSQITINSSGVIHSVFTTGAGTERQHTVCGISFKAA